MSYIIGLYSIPDISNDPYPMLVHDHNLAVLEDGKLISYLHLERYTRTKYDSSLPKKFKNIIKNLNLTDRSDQVFIFTDHEIGRASIGLDGDVRFEASYSPVLKGEIEPGRFYFYGQWPEAYVINHELAHLYSCIPFYGDFKENSLLVHFDGGASLSNFSAWTFRNNKIKLLESHYSYKWLSALFNANALVFSMVKAKKDDQNSVPGKFMGLEAFGEYIAEIENWLVKNNFFSNIWSRKKDFFCSVKSTFGIDIGHIDNKDPFIQDIAATIHEIFVRESLKAFERLAEITNSEYLYYSGGSALNIKLNARLHNSGLFKEVFIPPCTGDSGLAIGAAVAGSIHKGFKIEKVSPYLNNYLIEDYKYYSYTEKEISLAGDMLAAGKVIAVCNGYGEAGPRALGNRSILGRADRKSIAKRISTESKQREWYRPVAPIMLLKNAELFTGIEKFPQIADFMLMEYEILPEAKTMIAGCVHSDGTSRIQILRERNQNKYIYDLLNYLDRKYGIKALINTSFNRKGEPIVHTHKEAIESASAMSLDGVVLNGKLKKL